MTMINMFRMFLIFFIAHLVMGFFVFMMIFVVFVMMLIVLMMTIISVFSALVSMFSSSIMNFMYQFIFSTSEMWFITAVFKIGESCRLPIVCISVIMMIANNTALSMTITLMMTNTIKGSKFMNGSFTLRIVVSLSFFNCNCKNFLTFFLLRKQSFILIYFIWK